MKHNWTYKKLGELVNIRTGKLDANAANENGMYPFFTCSREPLRINSYSYDCECVLVAGNGELNVKYYNGKFDAYQRTYIIEKKKEIDYISTYYIYLFFQKYIDVLRRGSIGGIIKYIKLGDLTNALIPIPSLSEQESIVAELDAINHLIDLQEQQLCEYDRLAQSLFYTTFGDPATNPKGWEVKKLGEVAKEKLSYGSGASAVMFDETTRYVRITDIKDNGELNDDIVSPNTIEDKYLLNEGDILFARSGATVGKTYMHKSFNGRCIYAGYLIRLIPDKDIVLPTYLFHLTKTEYYRAFIASGQRTVAQPNINAQQYGNFRIPLPPLSLQQSFAAQIEAIEQQKALIRRSLEHTRTLLAARMQYYFE